MTSKRLLQDKFLRVCRESVKTLVDVLDDLGITHQMLDGWLDEPLFRRRVRELRKSLSRVRELELERGATAAARRITRFAIGAEVTFRERERRACLDVIRLWNTGENVRRKKIRPNYPKGCKRVLAHPEVADAKAVLRRMETRKA